MSSTLSEVQGALGRIRAKITDICVKYKRAVEVRDSVRVRSPTRGRGIVPCVCVSVPLSSLGQTCGCVLVQPTLTAVSKTKPATMVQEAYALNQRHFGENYVQELVQKAPLLPADIQWHFIGHLQSNKCKTLLEVPNVWMVESVDTEKLARQLEKACVALGRPDRLRVLVQVNTSQEPCTTSLCFPPFRAHTLCHIDSV